VVSKGFNLNWLDFSKITTGIIGRSQELNNVTISPNPITEDKFKISFDNFNSNEVTLQIISISGNLIYSEKIERPASQEIEFSLKKSGVTSKGVYFISFKSSDGYLIRKIIVL
jgi:5-methylcytosine-specific restriction endonuclease McrBC regulatory subunit McrC